MDIISSFQSLKNYCTVEKYEGWDPYDGLNSKVFQSTPFKYSRFFRLAWIQLFKRNPLNLRELLLVPKGYNSKGIALFLSGYCNLFRSKADDSTMEEIHFLAGKLIELRNREYSGACWGYNFDWQNRIFFQPVNTPTVVATSFAANSMFEAYEISGKEEYLEVATSSGKFVASDLNRFDSGDELIFSYSPLDNSRVYNASLLGARLLARCCYYRENNEWLDLSRKAVKTVTSKQTNEGAWIYGEASMQNWIDSFHTGFNLECINDYMKYSSDNSFRESLERGLRFYLENFFLDDGTPKYYHNRTYPVDIHSPAQFIVTLCKLGVLKENRKLADKVMQWTVDHMQDKNGYFYYQIKKHFSSKIPYMRWAQAWMFYAFCEYFKEMKIENLDRPD